MGEPINSNIEPSGTQRYEGVSNPDPISSISLPKDSVGSMTKLEVKKFSVENDSIKSEAPQLAKPDQLLLATPSRKEDQLDVVIYPKIVPFLAILTLVMNELAKSQAEAHYLQADVAMKQFANVQSSYKITAVITEKTAEKEAAMYLSQALSSVGQGMASFAQMGLTFKSASKAQNDPAVVDMDQKIAAKQDEINNYQAPDPNDPNAIAPPKTREKLMNELGKLENQRTTVFHQKLQDSNLNAQAASEIMKNSVGAVGQLTQSTIASEKGQIEAKRQLEEGYKQAFQSRYEAAARDRDQAEGDFSKSVDTLKDLMKSYIAATKVNG